MTEPGPAGWLVTCEHAGNEVPPELGDLFEGAGETLRSHRGWDPGALPIATRLADALGVDPIVHRVSRLVVEPNRSLGHRQSFSEFTRPASPERREEMVRRWFLPHRRRVEAAVARAVEEAGRCVHLGVHTFTPVLDGVVRTADVALLYDPSRGLERELASRWLDAIADRMPAWRLRRNYPYRGAADGLTTALRKRHADPAYAGIELEINQALLSTGGSRRRVAETLAASLDDLIDDA